MKAWYDLVRHWRLVMDIVRKAGVHDKDHLK